MRTGLVLGAGGATAWIFHIAVLQTLAEESSFDATDAGIILGTSAGSSIAAMLRGGVTLEEMRRAATTPPSEDDRRRMWAEIRAAEKTLRPLSPTLMKGLVTPGGETTLGIAGLLPPGLFPTSWIASLPGMDRLETWPNGLWIPAVRSSDGKVVVFGRDRKDVNVWTAVEASSAVPGMFRPQLIGDEMFIDGGVVSSTHADVLLEVDCERVIIAAPMSRPSGGPFARNAHRKLQSEVDELRARGVSVTVIEPSSDLARIARGYPRRRPHAAVGIAHHATEATRLALS
jgi:NTE family protein